jgi:hypothetical protein
MRIRWSVVASLVLVSVLTGLTVGFAMVVLLVGPELQLLLMRAVMVLSAFSGSPTWGTPSGTSSGSSRCGRSRPSR